MSPIRRRWRALRIERASEIQMFYASTSAEYPAIFVQRAGVVALGIVSSPEFATNIVDIAALAQKARLPTMCEWSWMAERGCLFSYGPIFSELHRRPAFYLAKIFRGTPPGELPMELPVHFELVINFKVAKALGKLPVCSPRWRGRTGHSMAGEVSRKTE